MNKRLLRRRQAEKQKAQVVNVIYKYEVIGPAANDEFFNDWRQAQKRQGELNKIEPGHKAVKV